MIKIETTLKQLNDLFEVLGTWQAVADEIGYNRATVNRWFAGTRKPSGLAREIIYLCHYGSVLMVKS